MIKCVLVMDMPSGCSECEFCLEITENHHCCQRVSDNNDMCKRQDYDVEFYQYEKPNWCPLKPMPEKRPTIGKESDNDILCMNAGYNACIDELLKGEER